MVAKQPDPTPQEIQNLCDKIQAQWSERDRTKTRDREAEVVATDGD